ncbi:MAG TPA: glycosyltransferase [Streptosporangiaceae bacterium]|jgi:vancomycin aglycone glucosyltransferase|nr:glycosyltransferase [Streptosporangiaceae bacterium]
MRVLLSTYGSRGDVEPLVALAVQLQAIGVEARMCVPPDFAERLAEVGVPMVPTGPPVRQVIHGSLRPSAEELPQRAAKLPAKQFGTLTAAAEGCDAMVAVGLMQVAARSVAEKLGIPYVFANYPPNTLPSSHHAPLPFPGRPFPPGVTDNLVLWDLDAQGWNGLLREPLNTFRASIGLPPVGVVRDHVFTDHPWLAADPTLGPWPESADLDVVQTGAWILPDERPLPAGLEPFLDAGPPPVYVGFGSERAPKEIARMAIEVIRAQGYRALVGCGWADLALIDDQDDCFTVGEVNQQALFPRVAAVVHHGGAGTTTAAARAGAPQVLVPQVVDQPYWARRVNELGIGAGHDGPTPTAESLAAALKVALAPETRARAVAVAGQVRTDGAAVAAKMLVDVVSRGRLPVPA